MNVSKRDLPFLLGIENFSKDLVEAVCWEAPGKKNIATFWSALFWTMLCSIS